MRYEFHPDALIECSLHAENLFKLVHRATLQMAPPTGKPEFECDLTTGSVRPGPPEP